MCGREGEGREEGLVALYCTFPFSRIENTAFWGEKIWTRKIGRSKGGKKISVHIFFKRYMKSFHFFFFLFFFAVVSSFQDVCMVTDII